MSLGKEIVLLKARISEKKKRLIDLNRRAENYIIILRDIIDPSEDESLNLDLERAQCTVEDFIALNKEKQALLSEISKMERELNG